MDASGTPKLLQSCRPRADARSHMLPLFSNRKRARGQKFLLFLSARSRLAGRQTWRSRIGGDGVALVAFRSALVRAALPSLAEQGCFYATPPG